MKKEEEKTVVLNEENIMEQIEAGNRADSALTKQVQEQIQKEQNDRKAYELKRRFLKSSYQRDLALIQRRKERRASDIALYKIRQAGRLCRFMMGFKFDESVLEYAKTVDDIFKREELNAEKKELSVVVDSKKGTKKTFKLGEDVPAIIDVVDYDNMLQELNEKIRTKNNENDKTYQIEVNKLDLSYGEYYSSSWRW